jgi:hypothetical protein
VWAEGDAIVWERFERFELKRLARQMGARSRGRARAPSLPIGTDLLTDPHHRPD